MVKILVVDDEPDRRAQLEWAARDGEREVLTAKSSEQAIQLIQQQDFDVIVTDLWLETEKAGLNVLKVAKEKDIYTQVILVTQYGTPEISVETMRLGAFDYLERSAPGTDHLAMVRIKITRALEFREAILREKDWS